MTLQQKTLKRYRDLFPGETLRETSSRTQIQITRVFRLFNGKTMKVAELEAFERIINHKISENPGQVRLNSKIEEASTILSNEELAKLSEYVARKISIKSLTKLYVSPTYTNAVTA
jgi:hypothetical protein